MKKSSMKSKSTVSDKTKRIVLSKYNRCFECGKSNALTLSHILKKRWYSDYDDSDNIVLDCIDCHHIWDNGTFQQKAEMNSIDKRIDIIKQLYNKSIGPVKEIIKHRYNGLIYGLNDCGKDYNFIE